MHTRALLDAFDIKTLWDQYGIVSDIVVSISLDISQTQAGSQSLTVCWQPFTVGFPRADIHALLSPDILHQVIKGTFKDHLVTWVEEYLIHVHGKAGAAVIMADIDRRYV